MVLAKLKETVKGIDTTKQWFIFNYYLCGTIIMIASERQPAYGQFLQGAENTLKGLAAPGKGEDDAMVQLIGVLMNVLRILYGIYMLYGVLATWQSIQRDENWSKAATPPIFLLIAVTICDNVLTNIFSSKPQTSGTGVGTGVGAGITGR